MKFKKGKYYIHNGGRMLHMLAAVNMTGYGCGNSKTIIAEEFGSWSLIPCGMDKTSAQNWKCIKKKDWDNALIKHQEDTK